jgi:predicted ATPase
LELLAGYGGDTFKHVGRMLAQETAVLCFDELQVRRAACWTRLRSVLDTAPQCAGHGSAVC